MSAAQNLSYNTSPVAELDASGPPRGLTTTKAPYIELARTAGRLYIDQPYEQYTVENHDTWRRLRERIHVRWQRYANERFLDGVGSLSLPPDRVPRLEEVNAFLAPLTGFRALAVSGYIPAYQFFDCLRRREFPTTITIRDGASLDYLSEPDIFHDIAGHVPMHTDPAFADVLVRFGQCAEVVKRSVATIGDAQVRVRRATSVLKALARFFWFTVEFGLMRDSQRKQLRVYGSGLLSSYGEIAHAVASPDVRRYPVDIERLVNQGFAHDRYQSVLFWVDSFDHLFALVTELEQWATAGKLEAVAPGGPEVSDADVQSFLATEV